MSLHMCCLRGAYTYGAVGSSFTFTLKRESKNRPYSEQSCHISQAHITSANVRFALGCKESCPPNWAEKEEFVRALGCPMQPWQREWHRSLSQLIERSCWSLVTMASVPSLTPISHCATLPSIVHTLLCWHYAIICQMQQLTVSQFDKSQHATQVQNIQYMVYYGLNFYNLNSLSIFVAYFQSQVRNYYHRKLIYDSYLRT